MPGRRLSTTPGAIRARRHYSRAKLHQRIGRFTITEDLISALFWEGLITEAEADTQAGAESGIARLHDRFITDAKKRFV